MPMQEIADPDFKFFTLRHTGMDDELDDEQDDEQSASVRLLHEPHGFELPTTEPSYAPFQVNIDGRHKAVVQIKISPFRHKRYPGHIFYGSSGRYSACCADLNSDQVQKRVIEDTQRILNEYYPQITCDLASKS
jgi:hypothetical protein